MNDESLGVITEEEIAKIEQEIKSVEVKSNEMVISDIGEIEASTDVSLIRAVQRYRKMSLVPTQFKTDAQAAGAILFAKQLGLNPLQVWGEIACIHGIYSVYGTLHKALARRSPNFGEDEFFLLNKDQNRICADNKNLHEDPWAAVLRIKKLNGTVWNEYHFTIDDAKKAGILKNVWHTYPKDMLRHKTFARGYNTEYSDALKGVQCYEDLKTDWGYEKDVSGKTDLNDL